MAIRLLELHSFLFYNNLFYQNVDGQNFKKLPKKNQASSESLLRTSLLWFLILVMS